MRNDRPTVGVTFFLHKGKSSIWNNGALQNCVFLVRLLKASTMVGRVLVINAGHDVPPDDGLMLKGLGIEFVKLEDVIDELDVLIECGAQVSAENIARVRARGGRAIGYRFGNSYVIDMERMLFERKSGSVFNGAVFDEIWTNAQHMRTNAAYWETLYRCPVRCLPHIWDPVFIDKTIDEFPDGLQFRYQPGEKAKTVSIFEPNINVVKSCIVPMLVANNAFRRCPDALRHVYVTNAIHMKGHLTFANLVGALDLQRADPLPPNPSGFKHRISIEGRFNMPFFLAKHTDVVVSHQWENGLNYAYYDALYGHYPLVHNSELLPDGVGYRYHDFDAHEGGRLLASVLMSHDHRANEYGHRCDAFLETVRATAPANVEAHERALREVMGR